MVSSSQPTDFLSKVEDYFNRGQVYRPPEEIVTQLALCPRCMGGEKELNVLEESLLGMVSLDIRFYPESEAKLLVLTEEDTNSVDLDYIDEDYCPHLKNTKRRHHQVVAQEGH